MINDLREETAVFICSGCSRFIYEGEDVWQVLGEQFCSKCIAAAREVAIFFDFE